MKNNKESNNKRKTLMVAGIGAATILGGTLAYFTTSDTLTNNFKVAKYQTTIQETFTSPTDWTPGTTTPKTVTVKNDGTIPMAVRAKYTESWKSKNGDTLSLKDTSDNVASIINFNEGWTKDTDGYYYYGSKASKTSLAAGATSNSFISGVTFNGNIESTLNREVSADGKTITYTSTGDGYDDATYTLVITIETVQYDQAATVWE